MKKFYILLVFVLVGKIFVTAQNVFPTYEQGATWCMVDRINMQEISNSTITLKPDTLICGKVYTPLIVKNYPILQGIDIVWRDSLLGYTRQEGQRVYQLLNSCQELVLYDFSLEKGDTIYYSYKGFEVYAFVADLRYEMIRGISRKVLVLIFPDFLQSQIRYWAEGLGDLFHPLTLFNLDQYLSVHTSRGSSLLCISDKNGIQFGSCIEACGILSDTKESPSFNDYLKLSPNPLAIGSTMELQYQFQQPISGNINIVNVLGQVLHRQSFEPGAAAGTSVLDWSPTVRGVYWLVWQGEGGERATLQFVVQ